MTPELSAAILQILGFRADPFTRYCAAVVLTGLFYYPLEIAADVVPSEYHTGKPTDAGCAFALMADGLHLFRRTGRRASTDPKANFRWVNTWTITSRKLAYTWLARHDFPVPNFDPQQAEMTFN